MLVPAGGLSEGRMEWINANKKFFVPETVPATRSPLRLLQDQVLWFSSTGQYRSTRKTGIGAA